MAKLTLEKKSVRTFRNKVDNLANRIANRILLFADVFFIHQHYFGLERHENIILDNDIEKQQKPSKYATKQHFSWLNCLVNSGCLSKANSIPCLLL